MLFANKKQFIFYKNPTHVPWHACCGKTFLLDKFAQQSCSATKCTELL